MAFVSRTRGGSAIMSNGLIITPQLLGAQVTSLDLHFEPSAGVIARKLDTLGMSLKDFRTPLRRSLQQVIIPSIQMNFHKHGRPKWVPLAESTVKRKGSYVPLQRSGALKAAMNDISIWTIQRQMALLTDIPQSVWYGKVHQAGYGVEEETFTVVNIATGQSETHTMADVGAGGIPARPFVMIQPSDEPLIEQVFDIWLAERIAKAGFR